MTRRRQRGEGSIRSYETADGSRFRCEWYEPVDLDDPDAGVRRRSKGGYLTQKAAATALRKALSDVEEGRITREEGTILATYARDWVAGARIAETTRAAYEKMLRLQVIPHIGSKRIADLRPAHLSKLYRDLEDHGRTDGGGLGANSVLKVHVLLGTVLQAAVDDHLIRANPARSPRANPPSAREVRAAMPDIDPWSPEQSDVFLAWSVANHWLHPAWVVLAYTGLRRSELLGLRWSDVDLTEGRIEIRRGVTLVKTHGKGERMVIGPPKSGRGRTLDIDDDVITALRAWRTERGKLGFRFIAASEHVFAAEAGGPRHPERFSTIWRRAVRACRRELAKALPAGVDIDEVLPYTHMHGLRHHHGSTLAAGGVSIKVVQERLGHANISITQNYTHTGPTAQRDAVRALAAERAARRAGKQTGSPVGDAR